MSSSRNSCSTSCCTQCHFDIEPFLGVTARAVFSAGSFAFSGAYPSRRGSPRRSRDRQFCRLRRERRWCGRAPSRASCPAPASRRRASPRTPTAGRRRRRAAARGAVVAGAICADHDLAGATGGLRLSDHDSEASALRHGGCALRPWRSQRSCGSLRSRVALGTLRPYRPDRSRVALRSRLSRRTRGAGIAFPASRRGPGPASPRPRPIAPTPDPFGPGGPGGPAAPISPWGPCGACRAGIAPWARQGLAALPRRSRPWALADPPAPCRL